MGKRVGGGKAGYAKFVNLPCSRKTNSFCATASVGRVKCISPASDVFITAGKIMNPEPDIKESSPASATVRLQ